MYRAYFIFSTVSEQLMSKELYLVTEKGTADYAIKTQLSY